MKNIRLFQPTRLAAVAASALLAFNAVPAQAQTITTWAQSYGVGSYDQSGQPIDDQYYGTGNDLPTAIAPMPDGGVVVGGPLALFVYSYGAKGSGIVRYDRSGNIVWQTLLRQDNDKTDGTGTDIGVSTVKFLHTDAAGNILVAGDKGGTKGSSQVPFVAKFAADGTLVWENNPVAIRVTRTDNFGVVHIDDAPFYPLNAFGATRDGGIVIGGPVGISDGRSIPWIAKFNADGTLAFHREYASTNQYSGTRSVCQRQDADGYALLMDEMSGSPDNIGNGVVLVLTDAVGTPVSQRILDAGSRNVISTYITPSGDGGYLVSGPITLQAEGAGVRKLNADLTTVWAKNLFNCGFNASGKVWPTADGGCLICSGWGAGVEGVPGGTALLMRLDKDGIIRFAHFYGGRNGDSYYGRAACVTTDGAMVFAVDSYSYGTGSHQKTDWWTVKVAAKGELPGFTDISFNRPLGDFAEENMGEAASFPTSQYGPAPTNEADPSIALSLSPRFVLENLAQAVGIEFPTVKVQAPPTTVLPAPIFFNDEVALGKGVEYLQFPGGNPFGYYSYLSDPHYIFHFDLGYEYVFDANNAAGGVYLYDFKSDTFFYTSPSFPFPYLYDFTLNTVLYYFPDPNNAGHYNTDGVRYFVRLDNGQIFSK